MRYTWYDMSNKMEGLPKKKADTLNIAITSSCVVLFVIKVKIDIHSLEGNCQEDKIVSIFTDAPM